MDTLILVNKKGNEIGCLEKMETHLQGKLHRAFSIFVFNSEDQLLLQKRACIKYHSGGLWSNTCCSHPRYNEPLESAAHRRLKEEMGFDCDLKEIFHFTYKVKLDNMLIEHEYDHVFLGYFNGLPRPDPGEVDEYKWLEAEKIKMEVETKCDEFSYWFKLSINRVLKYINL